jgi:hypothetical protein
MTPLEKARLARANGGGAAKKPGARPARKPLPTFQAPADFKPHFVEVRVRTEKDGLLASTIKCTRFQGRYDPDADDKKKEDILSYDPATVIGIQARLAAVTYKTNAERKYPTLVKGRTEVKGAMRLPANTGFLIVLRVNRKAADGSLSVLIKGIQQHVKIEGKAPRLVDLDKKDPVYRAFRKVSRILPAAFKNVLMPPKRVRGARVKKEADDE